jgi:hypothetical protein
MRRRLALVPAVLIAGLSFSACAEHDASGAAARLQSTPINLASSDNSDQTAELEAKLAQCRQALQAASEGFDSIENASSDFDDAMPDLTADSSDAYAVAKEAISGLSDIVTWHSDLDSSISDAKTTFDSQALNCG